MKHLVLLFFIFGYITLTAQTGVGLVAFYTFEKNLADVTGNSANTGIPTGNTGYGCGFSGDALQLNGADQELRLVGPVTQEFDTEDFTVSFYFKSTGNAGTQYLLSKRSGTCTADSSFYIRYVPRTRTLNVSLAESPDKNVSLTTNLEANVCWYQVTVVRQNTRVRLYVNGRLRREATTTSRINIRNNGALVVGGADCLTANETRFAGLIDDLRFYYLAINELEARDLYKAPDAILNRDTLIYLGGSVDINISSTCATSFSWAPASDVAPPVRGEAVITPTSAGQQVYELRYYDDASGCTATDTIRINVVDPSGLDCNTVYLPNAFTPNSDGINETYGISNPYAIELISFEIFDRWGGRVFFTDNAFGRWDGYHKGEPVNPGVMLWRVRYKCQGIERSAAGSVTILR
ncbi:MAG: LamG-like jellyroll fold domain-containing protein [Saprospiraceae bacterium]